MIGPFGLREVATALAAIELMRPSNVLIRGETGTGKELAARAVAAALDRSAPYVAINVASIPSGVFEGQVFGHVAGAFSGAKKAGKGVVAAHDGGTVFFDEIGELSLDLQPKLLRLLENREIQPVGGERPITVDVALIAATHRDLEAMVEADRFREDLFARMAPVTLTLPPLRRRPEDVFAILAAIARRGGASLEPADVEVEAVERLLRDPWPTNVRGLHALWTRLQMTDPRPGLRAWAIREILGPAPEATAESPASPEPTPLTRESVTEALAACEHNESRAARRLGVSRGKLRRFLAKHFDGRHPA
jgi:DNA-binding NtrC family response regulator